MPLLGRAKYNLLQRQSEDEDLDVDDWQITDYRSLDLSALFEGLKGYGLEMDVDHFEELANEVDTPEELSDLLSLDQPKHKKPIYLYIFELWRRLLGDFETISIFSDELDHLFYAYEEDPKEVCEELQAHLFELSDILDCNVDEGGRPKPLFKHISCYLSNDLEVQIYSYIFDLIEDLKITTASQLLDRFYEYVQTKEWFDFLRLKSLGGASEEDATSMLARFVEQIKEKPIPELNFAFLRFLIDIGYQEFFLSTYKGVLAGIKKGEEFEEMLDILFEYYQLNDLDEKEATVRKFLREKKLMPKGAFVTPGDKQKLSQILF